ncbi:cell adhesion molecule DSCAM-like isoform X2 [Dreissena polymorpha]|uniref:cell adhesion molecule DSCAM-like isoform X2 n=1 Tax=Dreissena polymorpha TaxID=45954 RepID=UPI002264FAC0|nr:cell adhesion molecule DSCAM-like isoform X2 [Dreissena polymorpha]
METSHRMLRTSVHFCIFLSVLTCTSASVVILEHPASQAIVFGQDLFLNCKSRNLTSGTSDGLVVQWRLNNGSIAPKTSMYPNGTLLVPAVSSSDIGNYTCLVHDAGNNLLATSFSASVFHAYIKMFEVSPVPAYVIEDDMVSFDCITGESSPAPRVFWEKDGEVFTGGEQYAATYGGYPADSLVIQYSMRLTFRAKPHLAGAYSCVARNSVLKIDVRSLKVRLQVAELEAAPYVMEDMVITEVITPLAQPMIIDCPISGKPAVTVKWFKNDAPVDGTTNFFTLKNNSLHRPLTVLADEGRYFCEGTNSLGLIRSPNVTVTLGRIDLTFQKSPSDLYVIAGLSAKLHCTPPVSVPPASVTWYKNNALLVPRSGEQGLQVVKTAGGSWDIVFEEVQKQDEGEYFCVASNDHAVPRTRTSPSAVVRVGGAPIFIEPPVGMTIEKGKLSQLTCYVQGDPFPEVTWLFETTVLTTSEKVSFRQGNQELWIGNVNKANEGTYTCRAVNRYGTIQTKVYVKILVPPVVLQAVGHTIASVGDTVILPCGIYSDPSPRVTWYKDSAALVMGGRFTQIPDGLYITSVQVSDSGTYTCQASNVAGDVENSGTLEVLVLPYFTTKPENVTATSGMNVTLSCVAGGYPSPTLTWLFNGSSLFPKDTLLSLNQKQLLLLQVSWLHVGQYSCIATNNKGSAKAVATLAIRVPPKVEQIEGIPILYQGESLLLKCHVTGIPAPLIEWQFNRQSLAPSTNGRISFPASNSLSVKFVTGGDAGIYTCQTSNSAGVSQKDISVYVIGRPSRPVLQNVETLTATSVKLTWSIEQREPQTPVTRVVISYRKILESSIPYQNIQLGTNLQEYTVQGLDPASVYVLMVSAVNDAGTSDASNLLETKTFDAGPEQPRNVHVSAVSSANVTLTWEIPLITNGNIKKYEIAYRQKGLLAEFRAEISSNHTPSHDYVIKGLTPYTWYTMEVRGATIEGDQTLWGNWSDTVEARTAQAAPTGSAREVRAQPTSTESVQVYWESVLQDKQNGPIRRYYVTYWLLSNQSRPIGEKVIDSLDLRVNITDLDPWTWYVVKVIPENAGGRGVASDPVSVRTYPAVPAGSPISVSAEPKNSQSIIVRWKPPAEKDWKSDLSGFIIQYWNEMTSGSLTSLGLVDLSALISGLQPYTQYKIRVAAYTSQLSNGIGPYSENITAKTLQDVPGPVVNLAAAATATTLKLSWKQPEKTNGIISHYLVTYILIGPTTVTAPPDVSVNITEYANGIVEKRLDIFSNFSTAVTSTHFLPLALICDKMFGNSTIFAEFENVTDINQSDFLTQFNAPKIVSDWMKTYNKALGPLCKELRSVAQQLDFDKSVLDKQILMSRNITALSVTLTDLDPDYVYNVTTTAATEAGYGPAVVIQATTLKPTATPKPTTKLQTTLITKPQTTAVPPLGQQEQQVSEPLNLPVIVGGGVSGLVLILIILLLICCLFLQRRKAQSEEKTRVIQENFDDKQVNTIYGQLDRPRGPAIAKAAEDGTDSVDIHGDEVRFYSPRQSNRNDSTRSYITDGSGQITANNGRRKDTFMGLSLEETEADSSIGLAAPGSVKANPAFYDESASSSDLETMSVTMAFSAEDTQQRPQPEDAVVKRTSKMRSLNAAAIARHRSSNLHSRMSRDGDRTVLINDDVQIVFNERTAL